MIPRILHQTVKDKKDVPAVWQECMATWRTILKPGKDVDGHGAWTYHLWDDLDNERFVKETYPQYYRLYMDLPRPINRVDMVRYLFMHAFGGFFSDADIVCLRSIEPLRTCGKIVVGEYSFHLTRFVECAFLGSVPKHPFWIDVINQIQSNLYKPSLGQKIAYKMGSLGVHLLTGPLMFGHAVKKSILHNNNAAGIKMFPEHVFFPESNEKPYPPDSYTVHLCTGSWTPKADRLLWEALRRPAVVALLVAILLILIAFVAINCLSRTGSNNVLHGPTPPPPRQIQT